MNIPYCDFQDTGIIFKNKKIYQCSYCNTKLALENPDAKILCFKKHNENTSSLFNASLSPERQIVNQHSESENHFQTILNQQSYTRNTNDDNGANLIKLPPELEKIVNNQILSTESINHHTINSNSHHTINSDDQLCSKEQIEERLKICNACEHFKDNSCLLCGCVIVRDKNFNNKLAHKKHSCPINKWGPIS
jgi:hypothetical protein